MTPSHPPPRKDARRLGFGALLGVVACATWALPAGAAVLANYPDFSSIAGLHINGDAGQVSPVLRLTPAAATQTGTAYTTGKVLNHKKSFRTNFTISMHDTTTSAGDGMAFLVHSGSKGAVGDTGGGLGYGSIGDSVAVEFDTFDNGGPDEDANEVAIIVNGKAGVSRDAAIPSFQLYGGARHAWVSYRARSHGLKVFVSDTETKPSSPLVSAKVNLEKVLEGRSRAGFTAATGGANAVHDVLDWKLTQ